LRSVVQQRANDRTAALLALLTLIASAPLDATIEALRMIDPPSVKRGSAFCTVKSSPLTLLLKTVSKCSSVILPSGATARHAGDVPADLPDRFVQLRLAASGDEDVGAFGDEPPCGGQADAAVA